MSQLPPTYTPASGDEELEHLKELLAEAEELCLMLALEKHLAAQRAERELERISKETGEHGITVRHSHP
jgi:sugar phosphate isomerase/epimerase